MGFAKTNPSKHPRGATEFPVHYVKSIAFLIFYKIKYEGLLKPCIGCLKRNPARGVEPTLVDLKLGIHGVFFNPFIYLIFHPLHHNLPDLFWLCLKSMPNKMKIRPYWPKEHDLFRFAYVNGKASWGICKEGLETVDEGGTKTRSFEHCQNKWTFPVIGFIEVIFEELGIEASWTCPFHAFPYSNDTVHNVSHTNKTIFYLREWYLLKYAKSAGLTTWPLVGGVQQSYGPPACD